MSGSISKGIWQSLKVYVCMCLKTNVGLYKDKIITLDYLVSIRNKRKSNISCVEINLGASVKVIGNLKNSVGEIDSYM